MYKSKHRTDPPFFVFKEKKKHFLNFSNVELDKREGGPETANLDGSEEEFPRITKKH